MRCFVYVGKEEIRFSSYLVRGFRYVDGRMGQDGRVECNLDVSFVEDGGYIVVRDLDSLQIILGYFFC